MYFVVAAVALTAILLLALVNKLRLFGGGVCKSNPDLKGKVVVVTGSTSGIGFHTVVRLAKLQATVILLDRDPKRSADAADAATKLTHNENIEIVKCDLADLASVRNAAEVVSQRYAAVHLLVNNAGVMMCPLAETRQGYEMQYGTNHLGHFALTMGLLPSLLKGRGRVVCVSSDAHMMGAPAGGIDFANLRAEDIKRSGAYGRVRNYAQSKLANILFVRELQRRYGAQGLTAFSLHPGVVRTNLGRHIPFYSLLEMAITAFQKTPEEGAQTSLHCALAPLEELVPGEYYKDCKVGRSLPITRDEELSRRLWQASEDQVAAAFRDLPK